MFFFLAVADPVGDHHKVHNMAPTAVRFWCNTGTLQDWNNNMTICVQKTCHSALKQLVLRESYGAEIVNSMWQWGGEGGE